MLAVSNADLVHVIYKRICFVFFNAKIIKISYRLKNVITGTTKCAIKHSRELSYQE